MCYNKYSIFVLKKTDCAKNEKCATMRKVKNAKYAKKIMKLSKRQTEIIGILKEQGYAKVEYIARKTYISPSSIRRDLQYMENLGIVERDYGGVKLKGTERKHPPIQIRKDKDRGYKRLLSQKAVKYVKDGYSVILDSSTTCSYLVEPLSELKNITVFTNNIETAMNCLEKGVAVYVIGGKSVRGMPVLGGAYAEEMLEKISVDVAFLSSYGIDENGIVSDPSEEENKLRKLMIKCAKKVVLLLDKTKVGKSSLHVLCSVKDVDYFITNDDNVAKKYKNKSK